MHPARSLLAEFNALVFFKAAGFDVARRQHQQCSFCGIDESLRISESTLRLGQLKLRSEWRHLRFFLSNHFFVYIESTSCRPDRDGCQFEHQKRKRVSVIHRIPMKTPAG